MIQRTLSDEEMAVYRRPFAQPGESRRPTLTWPRQIPFDGQPADVHAIVDRYAKWLPGSAVPKLFVDARPGLILAHPRVHEHALSFANQRAVTVSSLHFVQEDGPDEIGLAIAAWLT